jgi:hypothetical protein
VSLITILLVVLIVFALVGGGFGYQRFGVAGGISPLGIVLLIWLLLYLTGNI